MTPAQIRRLIVFTILLFIMIGLVRYAQHRNMMTGAHTDVGGAGGRTAPPPLVPVVPVTGNATSNTTTVNNPSGLPGAEISDFAAELDKVRGFKNPALRSQEFGRILRLWIARDPEAALAYVRQLPEGNERNQGLALIISIVSLRDPDRAIALARDVASTRELQPVYSAIFAQLASQNVQEAIKRLPALPAGPGRDNALRAIADIWARADSAAALAWAQKLDPADRGPALEAILQSVAATDAARAIQLAQQSLTGQALERSLAFSLRILTPNDPQAAAAIVAKMPSGEPQLFASIDVARAYAVRDPAAGLAWINGLSDPNIQRVALNNLLDGWVSSDPVNASKYVAQMPAGPQQDAAASHLAGPLASMDVPNAIKWANSLPNASSNNAALLTIASVWSRSDPAAAAQWAVTLPAGATQTEALNGALSYWTLHDAPAAQNYVATLSGDTQAHAAAAIAPDLAQANPAATLAWVQSLPAATRDDALVAAYRRWLDNDATAALAWLSSAQLPPETKAKLAPSH